MTDSDRPPSLDRLTTHLSEGAHEETVACLDRLEDAGTDDRKRVLRAAEDVAEEQPRTFDGLAGPFTTFLTDDDRAVRLTAAKLFVSLARSDPDIVVPAVGSLAARLADDEEFYYVRARAAEALGYVALDHPEAVNDPETLADFRVGLSFDEPEVREKLAKGLAYVALGDPGRLRHQVSSLAEHLDDERELVRYHLSTALLVVGCARPEKLAEATPALQDRLTDESPYVQGRAAEALAVLVGADEDVGPLPELDGVYSPDDETPSFLTDRVQFLEGRLQDGNRSPEPPGELGTVESVRAGTDDVVEAITSPVADGECPHCGLELHEDGPPMCPRCGAPR